MRKTTVILLAALALGACNKDAVSPSNDVSASLDDAANLAFSASFAADPSLNFLGAVNRLPDNLKLTAAQETQIKALMDAFVTATKADHDALAAIEKQAKDAAAAGKSKDDVRKLLEQGKPARDRLQAAEQKLHADIEAVLTADQKAWLQSHQPKRCGITLTDDQKNQISGLIAGYEQANKADLDAIKAAFDQARTAHQNGASKEDVQKILNSVKPNMERVRAAARTLEAAIAALLTPSQVLSGCGFPKGPIEHLPG